MECPVRLWHECFAARGYSARGISRQVGPGRDNALVDVLRSKPKGIRNLELPAHCDNESIVAKSHPLNYVVAIDTAFSNNR